MTNYADKECHDCGMVDSADRMFRRSVAVGGSSSRTSGKTIKSHNRSTTGQYLSSSERYVPSSTTSTTTYRDKWICESCRDARQRAAVRRFLFWTVVLFVGVGLLLFGSKTNQRNQNVQNPAIENIIDSAPSASFSDENEKLRDSESFETEQKPTNIGTDGESPAKSAPDSVVEEGLAEVPDPSVFNSAQDAARKAYKSGKAERWREGKSAGYAVPSEEIVSGCRNIRFSIDAAPERAFATQKVCEE